jgi:8-amino-7-oxononanoate synthase
MSLSDRWNSILETLRAQGRHRVLKAPAGIDFCSNDYLGYSSGRLSGNLSPCPAQKQDAEQKYSRSGTASRLLRGHHRLWDEVESTLARWHGAEAALIFNSGYVANEGLLSTLLEPGDWVASDERNHASIIDGLRMAKAERFIFRHQDLNQLEDGLRHRARICPSGRESFVVTEALFGMEGDLTPLSQMIELTDRFGSHLIVDEAHSTGCFGPRGAGCVDEQGLRSHVLATVHTGGKALGVPGAYICGPSKLRDLMTNRCRHLIFTTALPPVVACWWLDAIEQVRADDEGRRLLHDNAATFRQELARHGVRASGEHYIAPLILGEDARTVQVAQWLQEAGWDVRAIRPPTVPHGTSRLRISVHADHSRETLAALAEALRS